MVEVGKPKWILLPQSASPPSMAPSRNIIIFYPFYLLVIKRMLVYFDQYQKPSFLILIINYLFCLTVNPLIVIKTVTNLVYLLRLLFLSLVQIVISIVSNSISYSNLLMNKQRNKE